MIQGQHTVGFAAAKGSFQLNDRLAILPVYTLKSLNQQARHAVSHIGSGKKFDRIAIFISAFPSSHLGQVSREFSVFITPLGHIRVGLNNIPPAWQTADGRGRQNAAVFCG
ncbi:hypothetical protein LJB99_01940 [Deltaproteobacteria bacterium OttesenSCG-928-K17]|nr:hypothetical protein [Deltaproteobacteria bacterium OttesenSCG-928-K17]